MPTLRASYSISADVLLRFNALVPSSERSGMVQSLMEGILASREKSLETVAKEFATHPDFAQARADSGLWDATSSDRLLCAAYSSTPKCSGRRRRSDGMTSYAATSTYST